MAAPVFSDNPQEWTTLEGLYINELPPPGTIKGVDQSTVAIVGATVRGPLDATEISSPSEFMHIFGGRDYTDGGALVNEVWRALLNKRFGKLVIARAAAAAASAALLTLDDGTDDIITITASSVGAWGNGVTAAVTDASNGVATSFNLVLSYRGKSVTYENLSVNGTDNNLTVTIGDNPANLVVVTKVAAGRPDNVTATALATGADGTIAGSDYTTALTKVKEYRGVSVVFCASLDATITGVFNTAANTAAAASSDRLFLVHTGDAADYVTDAVDVADAFTRTDRLVLVYNHPYTLDPVTGLNILTTPTEWLASVLSQTSANVHPGVAENDRYMAGVSRLSFPAFTRAEYKTLKAAGISTYEKDDGYHLVSAVTTSLVSGKEEITRRRMTDYLQISAGNRLKYYVKQLGRVATKRQIKAELSAFSKSVQDNEGSGVVLPIIAADDATYGPGFVIDDVSLNVAGNDPGLHIVLWRVRLIGHLLYIVLQTEIGTGLTISEV